MLETTLERKAGIRGETGRLALPTLQVFMCSAKLEKPMLKSRDSSALNI
jgi:hypothetical protein